WCSFTASSAVASWRSHCQRELNWWGPKGDPGPGRAFRMLLLLGSSFGALNRPEGKVLETVGVFEVPKQHGKYETGQVSDIFGYRGIVLFPWASQVVDRRRRLLLSPEKVSVAPRLLASLRGLRKRFLGEEPGPSPSLLWAFFSLGLDYVAHEDILPYIIHGSVPIQHEPLPVVARDTLCAWQEKNHPWLEASPTCTGQTTETIRVTVIPSTWWRYCIPPRSSALRIFSLSGIWRPSVGRRVVEPVLSKEQPAFQYSSHVSLQASSGHMWGTFRFERPDGSHFDVRIPPFSLESNKDEKTPPSGLHW
uniref:DNA polymerase delta interacting protein 2 n=1 Tax=Laticauda laticaudata TaxID=8630 RepID=A0A8C5RCJ4_LATLA